MSVAGLAALREKRDALTAVIAGMAKLEARVNKLEQGKDTLDKRAKQERDALDKLEADAEQIRRMRVHETSVAATAVAPSQPQPQPRNGQPAGDGRQEPGKSPPRSKGAEQKKGAEARPAEAAVSQPAASQPAAAPPGGDDEDVNGDGWLLSCEASCTPEEVTARLSNFLDGLQLVVIDLEPEVWDDEALFAARLRTVLGLPAAAGPLDMSSVGVTSALAALCLRDTLLLLRPKKWARRSIDMAGRFLSALEVAYDSSHEGKEVAAVLFGWRGGGLRVGPGHALTVTTLKTLDASGEPAAPPAAPAESGPAASAAPSTDGPGGAGGGLSAAASGGAAAADEPATADDGEWLFGCAAGTPLCKELGIDASTRKVELSTADLRYGAGEQLRAEGAFLLALAAHSGSPPPAAAEGNFWPTADALIAKLIERDTLFVLRGAWQPPPPGRRAGNPAGRRSAVPLFLHAVYRAYMRSVKACTDAEVVAVVVEVHEGGGARTIQGTWTDGSSFEHTVTPVHS